MNVALVIERMSPSRGGRERAVAQMAELLAEAGWNVSVLAQEAEWKPAASNISLEVYSPAARGRAALAEFVRWVRRRRGDFDIVHTTLPIPGCDIYQPRGGTIRGQIRAGRRRRGFLASRFCEIGRWFNPLRRLRAELERYCVDDAELFWVPNSRLVARELAEFYGRTERVRMIYNGIVAPDWPEARRQSVRARIREELNIPPNALVFATLATNWRLKAIREEIYGFSQWVRRAEADGHLLLAGNTHPEKYLAWADQYGVANRVHALGKVDEPWETYAASDAVVLLSWYDACSRVVLEALAWGMPAVTTAYNGAAEALKAGSGMIIKSPADAKGLIAAFDALAQPERRRIMRQAPLPVNLSMARHVDELIDLYADILENKS